jgi:hypothetical protein
MPGKSSCQNMIVISLTISKNAPVSDITITNDLYTTEGRNMAGY